MLLDAQEKAASEASAAASEAFAVRNIVQRLMSSQYADELDRASEAEEERLACAMHEAAIDHRTNVELQTTLEEKAAATTADATASGTEAGPSTSSSDNQLPNHFLPTGTREPSSEAATGMDESQDDGDDPESPLLPLDSPVAEGQPEDGTFRPDHPFTRGFTPPPYYTRSSPRTVLLVSRPATHPLRRTRRCFLPSFRTSAATCFRHFHHPQKNRPWIPPHPQGNNLRIQPSPDDMAWLL